MLRSLRCLIPIAAFVAAGSSAHAQEPVLSGTVTDTTGAVLPGVVITAVHEASGNTFEAASDQGGNYRMPVRIGTYTVSAELQGFAKTVRSGLELQVGELAVLNLQLTAGAQETVTVTSELPLLDVRGTRIRGVVDVRQVEELPVNGRNFLDLVMTAPGNRANAVADNPVPGANQYGNYQINVNGQQVTQEIAGLNVGNASYSKDAIAEFEFVANRFDVTQGRSAGVQVNVVTKSGSNTPSGSASGYFRSDKFNAADFIQRRVLPFSDQQISATYGGPLRKDRLHLFVNYEYERNPLTSTYSTPYPVLNVEQYDVQRQDKYGGRLDFQVSPKIHWMTNAARWDNRFLNPGTNVTSALYSTQHSRSAFSAMNHVLNNVAVNELKGGWEGYWYSNFPIARSAMTLSILPDANIVPNILLTGLSLGQSLNPSRPSEDVASVRDDLTYVLGDGGHTLKAGGEFLAKRSVSNSCRGCMGTLDAQGGRVPSNIDQIFPNPLDARTWNLNQLTALGLVRSYTLTVGNFQAPANQNYFAGWLQDEWALSRRLTVTAGLRYDLGTNLFGNATAVPPFLTAPRPNDTNNWQPRLGAAYTINDRTVIRGGAGRYYATLQSSMSWFTTYFGQTIAIQVPNDGRPDFATNPFNGPAPTYEQVLALNPRGRTFPPAGTSGLSSPDEHVPYSLQASLGLQRQLGTTMSLSADYTFTGNREDIYVQNVNLTYNPATGANYLSTDVAHLPYPTYGPVAMILNGAYSNYNGLSLALSKRMSQRWQASGNYLLSIARDGTPAPTKEFPVAVDLGGDYSLSVGDQRHRVVFNGIYQIGYGFQVSGLYFYGSGQRFATSWGGDLRGIGAQAGGSARLRPNGTVVPRNNFVGQPVHRVDVRLQREFGLGGRTRIQGLVEVFNLFNHVNYGSYATAESLANYGQPAANTNVAYTPRAMQLGFRLLF